MAPLQRREAAKGALSIAVEERREPPNLGYATLTELKAFVKARRRELKLSDDDVTCLYLRRRRLSLDRKVNGRTPLSPGVEEVGLFARRNGQPPTPIKVTVLGEPASELHLTLLRALLQRDTRGTAPLPVCEFDVPLTRVGESVPTQLWAPDSAASKQLRSWCFDGTEVFVLVVDVRSAESAAACLSGVLAEVRGWQALPGGSDSLFELPIVLAGAWSAPSAACSAPHAAEHAVSERQLRTLAGRLGLASVVAPPPWPSDLMSGADQMVPGATGASAAELHASQALSVLQEAVMVAVEARSRLDAHGRLERSRRFDESEKLLRPHMTTPTPRARLDTARFEVVLDPPPPAGVSVRYSLGSEPPTMGHPQIVDGRLRLPIDDAYSSSGSAVRTVRPGSHIALRSFSQGRYPSGSIQIELPARAPPPRGSFDWAAGVYRLSSLDGAKIVYSTDGRWVPSASGARKGQPPQHDYDPTLGCVASSRDGAAGINAVAVVDGLWPSEAARLEPPTQLMPPATVEVDPTSRLLTMSAPAVSFPGGPPGAEWRYTLDGSAPTQASPVYTGPVQLPPDGSPQPITRARALHVRVVAYPAAVRPSEELSLRLPLDGARPLPLLEQSQ